MSMQNDSINNGRADNERAAQRRGDNTPEEEVETVATETGPDEANSDVVSDPARDDRVGSDWADEGGATPDPSET